MTDKKKDRINEIFKEIKLLEEKRVQQFIKNNFTKIFNYILHVTEIEVRELAEIIGKNIKRGRRKGIYS